MIKLHLAYKIIQYYKMLRILFTYQVFTQTLLIFSYITIKVNSKGKFYVISPTLTSPPSFWTTSIMLKF